MNTYEDTVYACAFLLVNLVLSVLASRFIFFSRLDQPFLLSCLFWRVVIRQKLNVPTSTFQVSQGNLYFILTVTNGLYCAY